MCLSSSFSAGRRQCVSGRYELGLYCRVCVFLILSLFLLRPALAYESTAPTSFGAGPGYAPAALVNLLSDASRIAMASESGQNPGLKQQRDLAQQTGDGWTFFPLTLFALLLVALVSWLKYALASRARVLREASHQREVAEQEVRQAINFDADTGLAKLPHFLDQLDDYIHAHQLPVAQEKELLVLKLTNLDAIVRTFGIARAELVTSAVARHLLSRDAPAAYLGRGVFAAFLDKGKATELFDRLAKAVAASEPGLHARFSGGSAYWPEQGRSAGRLMRHAETALAMGEAHRSRWTAYDMAMEPSRLAVDIMALFADGTLQGIFPVFQPQLDLHTGNMMSAEVLVRWQHPRLGVVWPEVLIPLLENSGLISQLTTQMIGAAVRVAAVLRARNLPCCISVNITAQDVTESNLADIIGAALRRYQGEPGDIKLELTEATIASESQSVIDTLAQLSEAGIDTAIDDFGIGHSALAQLSTLPIREVKIDRSLVGDMIGNPRHHATVRAVIAMARELGFRVVAEGVEDDQTLQILRKEGCDIAQGNVIARPLPEAEFIEFMHAHAATDVDLAQFMKGWAPR